MNAGKSTQGSVMRFTIINCKSGHSLPQNSCDFLAPGGTIGRSADNNLVLPDDDRAISRLQAIVHVSAQGECRITNRGNVTKVVLNDIPLERGRQVELQDGDILGIDDYRIEVTELVSSRSTVQPQVMASPQVAPQPQVMASPQVAPQPQVMASPQVAPQPQVMASPQVAPQPQVMTSPQVAPQPQVMASPQVAAQPQAVVTGAQSSNEAAVPSEIWDSLAQEFSLTGMAAQVRPQVLEDDPLAGMSPDNRNPEDPLAQLVADSKNLSFARQETDPTALFAGDGTLQGQSILNDTTPSALLQESHTKTALQQVKKQDELDPLALFGGAAMAPQSTNSDDPLGLMMSGAVPLTQPDIAVAAKPAAASEFHQPVPPPEVIILPAPSAALQAESVIPDAGTAQPAFDDKLRHGAQEDILASFHGEAPHTEPSRASTPHAELFDIPQPAVAPEVEMAAQNGGRGGKGRLRIDPVDDGQPHTRNQDNLAGNVLSGELLNALLEGIGLHDLQPTPKFDTENMHQLGRMLSLFSQGTVALLSSRSILKRGVKAEMTMILDEANNPFKLLPSGKTVLMQMFGTRMPGFMPAEQSVRDALIDLQAHQLGMIAGIRAIIAAMLQSFNPGRLEAEARNDGVSSRLALPNSRKAALWDYFTRSYNKTAGEIEDDFHTLFGEAFLHAYDVEVNQYKESQTRPEE